MPFDSAPETEVALLDAPEPLLSPAVADLPPRERRERLRLWLLTPVTNTLWDYAEWKPEPHCGTAGCAGGWYEIMTDREIWYTESEEFEISSDSANAIFLSTHNYVDKTCCSDVTPADVAHVIGMVQRGEIQ